ncbi:MAG: hypothetical protein QME12_05185, partial [Nanoarchaeota archaeon]|nr:hypothetical protein [Nanoarchaeota archaeon]
MLSEKIISNVYEILALKPSMLHIQISLDGPEAMHDKMRGIKGCYEKAIATLEKLESIDNEKLQLSIMTTICRTNFEVLPDFAAQMTKEHFRALHKFNIVRGSSSGTFMLPKEITSGLDTEEEQVPLEKMEGLFKYIEKSAARQKDEIWQKAQKLKWQSCIALLKNQTRMWHCMAGYTFGVIYSNGDVTVCEPVKPFANLKEFNYDFYRLWHSRQADETRKKIRKCYCIHPCNVLDSIAYDTKSIFKMLRG